MKIHNKRLKELNAKENETLDAIADEQEAKRLRRNEKARERRAQKRADERALAQDAKRVLRLV